MQDLKIISYKQTINLSSYLQEYIQYPVNMTNNKCQWRQQFFFKFWSLLRRTSYSDHLLQSIFHFNSLQLQFIYGTSEGSFHVLLRLLVLWLVVGTPFLLYFVAESSYSCVWQSSILSIMLSGPSIWSPDFLWLFF